MEVVYFIVLVGVLISVHELGHFVCAKFFGVRVLKFSLGFGPKIAGITHNGTEYVIAAFPLGGYVRMLGEDPHDTVREEEMARAFSQQPLWKRAVIVVAGPAMNLLLPLVLFFVVYLGDAHGTPAVIGTVLPDQPADGVLEPGDRVLRANGEEISTFYELARIIGAQPDQPVELLVSRDGEERHLTVTPERRTLVGLLDRETEVGQIGIKPHHPLAVVGVTSPASPAAAARLRSFDRIVAAGPTPVDRWMELVEALGNNDGVAVPLTYMRPTRIEGSLGGLLDLEIYEPHVAMINPEQGPGDGLTRAGLEPADLYVSQVSAVSPDAAHGVRPGDRLLELDGRPIALWARLLRDIEAGGVTPRRLSWRRADQIVTRDYVLRSARADSGDPRDERLMVFDEGGQHHLATLGHWSPTQTDAPVPNPSPITYAIGRSFRTTWELVEVTVYSVIRLLEGRVSVRSAIGGPIRIYEATEMAARQGAYLSVMALISINLGLINLLPIPMLDGGHLLFLLLEAVSRRPVSLRLREIASTFGLVVLVLLMVLAFTNDIERQWPRIVEAFEDTSEVDADE